MKKQIIKYGAVAMAAMFSLASCHWHGHGNGVIYVEHSARPAIVHHVDHKPKHHKPKKHGKAPVHVKRPAPAPGRGRGPQPVPHKGPHGR